MRNLLLIARFEITRLLFTRRGWVSILAFALVWGLLLYYVVLQASRLLTDNNTGGLISLGLNQFGLDRIATWAVPELGVYWLLGLILLPFFCITLTADQTASDRARGTLRFLLLRASRAQVFFGRFTGQMLVQSVFIAATAASTLLVVLNRSGEAIAPWLQLAPAAAINLLLVLLPYTALMSVVSILAKSARQATLYAIILWIVFGFLIRYLLARFPDVTLLEWAMPGSQIPALMRVSGWDALQLSPTPLLQTAILLFVGWMIARRIDL